MTTLLLSNSTNSGGPYLGHAWDAVLPALDGARELLFVPYALADHYSYTATAAAAFAAHGVRATGLHRAVDPVAAIRDAPAVFIGGGNTFRLLKALREKALLEPLRAHVAARKPYLGASAGSNVAAPTIRTTNDMPIVDPGGFDALGLIGFQLNCHYLDADPASTHAGETRRERLEQYLEENGGPVLGLREGTHVRAEGVPGAQRLWVGGKAVTPGRGPALLFRRGADPLEVEGDVTALLGP